MKTKDCAGVAFVLLTVLLAAVMFAPPAGAATITVNSADDTTGTGVCTLRDAITSANGDTATGGCAAGSGDDIIVFDTGLSGQTITLTSALPSLSTNIAIDCSGPDSHVQVSGNDSYRVFEVEAGATVSMDHLDIIDGNKSGFYVGGGIWNKGTLTVTDATFSGNSAGNAGGGICNDDNGTLTVTNAAFSGNSTDGQGGGIWNSGTLTVIDSTFSKNSADTDSIGGGIFNTGTLTVTDSTFSENSASGGGGGIYSDENGTLTVTDSTFSANSDGIHNGGTLTVTDSTFSANSGSGIRNNAGTLTVTNSVFSANSASGIWGRGTLTVTNSTFSGNSSTYGGGIYNDYGGTLTVTDSTFSGNSATTGGNIYNYSGASLTLRNTILADNAGGGDLVNNGGTITEAINNLIEDTGTNAGGLTDGDNGNIIGYDPLLSPLADNGGPTQTMALQPGSLAIDAGNTTSTVDQRGVARPQGVGYDIGAYEFDNTAPTVTTAAAASVSTTSAVLGGNVTDQGGLAVTARGVCWGTSSDPTVANSKKAIGNGIGKFSGTVTGLKSGTVYYVRAYAVNSVATAYGNNISFKTDVVLPVVTTGAVSNVCASSATCGGSVTIGDGFSILSKGLCWDTAPDPRITDPHTDNGTALGDFTGQITNLQPETSYYVRAYAQVKSGGLTYTIYGEQFTFTTPGEGLSGDADGDGKVSLADAVLILKLLAGADIGDAEISTDADVNGDGQIGMAEVIYILRFVADFGG